MFAIYFVSSLLLESLEKECVLWTGNETLEVTLGGVGTSGDALCASRSAAKVAPGPYVGRLSGDLILVQVACMHANTLGGQVHDR